jgi:hypothetical protein
MKDNYKVKCFSTDKDKLDESRLPRACKNGILPKKLEQFGGLVVGRTGSGKTNVMLHMLTDERLLGGAFKKENIFLYSALKPDPSISKNLQIPKKNIITKWDEPEVKTHLDKLEKQTKKDFKSAPYTLLIFDDILSKKKFLKSPTMSNLATCHRHWKCCYFILTQYYKGISPVVRTNCSYLIFFASSEIENEKLYQEQCPSGCNKKKFMKLVNYATSEPYEFLSMNTRAESKKKMRKGFNEIIWID